GMEQRGKSSDMMYHPVANLNLLQKQVALVDKKSIDQAAILGAFGDIDLSSPVGSTGNEAVSQPEVIKMSSIHGKAVAFSNNDYVHVAWDFGDSPLVGCGGFAVYRTAQGEDPRGEPVPAFGRDSKGNRTKISCFDQPIRKYSWRDVFARR